MEKLGLNHSRLLFVGFEAAAVSKSCDMTNKALGSLVSRFRRGFSCSRILTGLHPRREKAYESA